MRRGRKERMSKFEKGLKEYKAGLIELEEAVKLCYDPDNPFETEEEVRELLKKVRG